MKESSHPALEDFVLYKSPLCGFCFRVTRFLKRQGIDMRTRDIMLDRGASRELSSGGGRSTVPCLRIEQSDGSVQWMYESLDIVNYLTRWVNQQP